MATAAVRLPHSTAGEYEKSGLWSWLTTVDHKRIGALYMWIPGGLYFYTIISVVFYRWQQRDGVESRAGAQVGWIRS